MTGKAIMYDGPIDIEDNEPVTVRNNISREETPLVNAIATLKVGQSFFVPLSDCTTDGIRDAQRWLGAKGRVKANYGKHFIVRVAIKSGVKGLRMWRDK